jgi:hypothetical protein
MYQSVTRPSLRPDEKSTWSVIFKSIFSQALSLLETNIVQLGQDYYLQNQYVTIYVAKNFGSQFESSTIDTANYVVFPLDRAVIYLPYDALPTSNISFVEIVQYKFNPIYPNSAIMTS